MPLTQDELDDMARNPESASNDAGSAKMRSADDIIKLSEHAKAVEAATNGKPAIRIFKLVPPGTV